MSFQMDKEGQPWQIWMKIHEKAEILTENSTAGKVVFLLK